MREFIRVYAGTMDGLKWGWRYLNLRHVLDLDCDNDEAIVVTMTNGDKWQLSEGASGSLVARLDS